MKRNGFNKGFNWRVAKVFSGLTCFLGLLFVLFPLAFAKEYILKLSFPSSIPEKPQKPKIDFQTLVEKTEIPIELRNFRLKEEAEKEKKLVLKSLPRHILESKSFGFDLLTEKRPCGLNVKLDFFSRKEMNSWNNFLTLRFHDADTNFNIFSGFLSLPKPSTIIGGSLKKEYKLHTFCLSLAHKKDFLMSNPSGLYNFSLLSELGILNNLNLLFDVDYLHFYNATNVLYSFNPRMEVSFRPSNSWLFKGEFSYSINPPLLSLDDYSFFDIYSSPDFVQPINASSISLSIFKSLFSDFRIGLKFSYKEIYENLPDGRNSIKAPEALFAEKGSSFQSLLIFSREKGTGIGFSLSSGILLPSIYLSAYNINFTDNSSFLPPIFTFSSLIKGDIQFSGTSFEINYNWASFPYISLSLKDIYSSRIVFEQELPLSKLIGGNIAIVVELRNFINFLKPPITDRYLLIFYPRWIRGGLEIEF